MAEGGGRAGRLVQPLIVMGPGRPLDFLPGLWAFVLPAGRTQGFLYVWADMGKWRGGLYWSCDAGNDVRAMGTDGTHRFGQAELPDFPGFASFGAFAALGVDWSQPDHVLPSLLATRRHAVKGGALLLLPRRKGVLHARRQRELDAIGAAG